MMKIEKNYKIIDLLTKLRKKRISPPADLNLYRVRYDKNSKFYSFNIITPDDYNTDVFYPRNRKSEIFFICCNKDPRKPILSKYNKYQIYMRN